MKETAEKCSQARYARTSLKVAIFPGIIRQCVTVYCVIYSCFNHSLLYFQWLETLCIPIESSDGKKRDFTLGLLPNDRPDRSFCARMYQFET